MAASKLDGVLSTLWTEQTDKLQVLAELKTNRERVDYAFTNNIFTEAFKMTTCNDHEKSARSADKLRAEGNQLYKMKKYEQALTKYNASILAAPFSTMEIKFDLLRINEKSTPMKSSNSLTLGFSNRSAALFQLDQYKSCLIAIEYSIDLGYPNDQVYKLYDRAARCHMALLQWEQVPISFNAALKALDHSNMQETGKSKWIRTINKELEAIPKLGKRLKPGKSRSDKTSAVPQLTDGASLKYPAASAQISVEHREQKGRCVLAVADYKPGDVLFIQKPYSAVLYQQFYQTYCSQCHIPVSLPYPCKQCTQVVYCSRQCLSMDWPVHSIECGQLELLSEEWIGKLGHVALRAVISAPKDALKSTNILKTPDPNIHVFDNTYHHFCQLVTHESDRGPQSNVQLVAMAVYLTYVLRMSDFLQDLNEKVICQHLLHSIQVVQCNGFAISYMKNVDDFHHSMPEDIGQGIYLTLSFVNHSCDPNVEPCFYGTQCVARAIKVIHAGDEVCLDYGSIFTLKSKPQRQIHLQCNYLFVCQCIACNSNWPTFDDLNEISPVFRCQGCSKPLSTGSSTTIICTGCEQKMSIHESIDRLAKSHDQYSVAAKNAFHGKISLAMSSLQDHLSNMDQLLCQPWKEYYSCQATIKQCFHLLATAYSLKCHTTD